MPSRPHYHAKLNNSGIIAWGNLQLYEQLELGDAKKALIASRSVEASQQETESYGLLFDIDDSRGRKKIRFW